MRVKCTGYKSDCKFQQQGYPHLGQIRDKIKKHNTSVSSIVATKIASGYNQTATAIFVGKRGKGKSHSMGSIMEGYAAKMAVLMDGNPWEVDPSKYFKIENVGIIDMQDIIRVLKMMKEPSSRYCAYMLDDIGKTLDARDFMSQKNKLLNKIFQTCRTKNVFTGMTIPDGAGLDKDPRENSDFFAIMEQSIFDYNLSVGRFFEQNKQYRSGAMWYMYIRAKGGPVVRHAFLSPSKKFVDEYEPRRAAMADKLFDDSMLDLDKLLAGAEETKEKRVTRKDILLPAIEWLHNEGYTIRQIAHGINVSKSEVGELLKSICPSESS